MNRFYIAGVVNPNFDNYIDRLLLNWTNEPPTEKGWYWTSCVYGNNKRYQRILYIDEKQTYYSPVDWDDERREHIRELGNNVYYLGPLPEPEMPE